MAKDDWKSITSAGLAEMAANKENKGAWEAVKYCGNIPESNRNAEIEYSARSNAIRIKNPHVNEGNWKYFWDARQLV